MPSSNLKDTERSKCKQSTSTQKHYERGAAVIEVQVCQHRKKESLILPGASIG
jgi:Na+-transporting methylmalonyl-CoA/oxaloacetate decarboxylase gamma subunit